MANYDMIAIDLDGTLLNSRGEVSQRNLAAIDRARAAGIEIVLATGRAWVESRHVIEHIGQADGVFIGAGGAAINRAFDGETLWRSAMEARLIERAAAVMLAHGHLAHLLKDRHETGYDYLVVGSGVLDPATEWWFRTLPVMARYAPTMEGDAHPGHTLRCGTVAASQVASKLAGAIRAALGDAIVLQHWPAVIESNASVPAVHMLEIFNPDVDKWTALERYAHQRGVAPHRIAAIGDGINDVRMIRSAGLGIAMANASAAVMHVAGHMTGHHDADGLAEAVEAIVENRL